MWAPMLTVSDVTLCFLASMLVACVGEGPVGASPYSCVIVVGFSGSRLRMYNKTKDGLTQIAPSKEDEDSLETEPWVPSYANMPDKAGESLDKVRNLSTTSLDTLLKAAIKYVPQSNESQIPLWIKATAGMKLYLREKLPPLVNSMDNHLKRTAALSQFKYMGLEVLGGEEEAVFAWISTNFILGKLVHGYKATAGILDMGGASMQVAFNPGQDIKANNFSFYVNNSRMSVYAKSYIKFGLRTAVERAMDFTAKNAGNKSNVEYPCFHRGYGKTETIDGRGIVFTGTGNPDTCNETVAALLHRDYECLLEPCALIGVHMPKVKSSTTYYGLGNFFYILHGMGLISSGEAKSITPKAILHETQKFCKKTPEDAKKLSKISKIPWKYSRNYCFGGLYVYRILMAFGFEEDSDKIIFARKLNGKSADWSMGTALYETQSMPVTLQGRDLSPDKTDQQKSAMTELGAIPRQPVLLCTVVAVATLGIVVLAVRGSKSTHHQHSLLDNRLEKPEKPLKDV